jgi:uncharacterized protein YecE (DUF72 family)
LTRFLIGTGGWTYFQVPNTHPLKAYSKAFNFVEVNSTFYRIPNIKSVESWRRMVPSDFEFSVRCNQEITHNLRFQSTPKAHEILEKMINICGILNSEFLHFLTPASFQPNKFNSARIRDFFSTTNLGVVRPVLEVRSKIPLESGLIEILRDLDIVHSVDLLKGKKPAYNSDILYTRLFGKGYYNIYQPLDSELREVDRVVSQGNFKKAIISMHSNRMFKDAARFKLYKETGGFPMVTKSTGINSLVEVLQDDAKFPSTKEELVLHQGWKVIDLSEDERVRASYMLSKLSDKLYYDITEIVKVLETR